MPARRLADLRVASRTAAPQSPENDPVPFGSPFDDEGDTRTRQRRRDPDYLFGDDPGY